jgi:transcription elongation GreA/GreB family factor
VNKQEVLGKIVEKLAAELDLYLRAAKTAAAEATDEQSKAENKYDTRGLEASYLARGQSRQAAEIESAVLLFRSLATKRFAETDPIDIGALVELKGRRARAFYFMGPKAGGTEVEHAGEEITVITPPSPLGGQLMGKKVGDRVKMPSGEEFKVISVI